MNFERVVSPSTTAGSIKVSGVLQVVIDMRVETKLSNFVIFMVEVRFQRREFLGLYIYMTNKPGACMHTYDRNV